MRAAIILAGLALAAVAGWFGLQSGRESARLLIEDAVAAPLEGGGAVAFLAIDNRGAPDRLIGVASPAATATLYSPEDDLGPPVPTGVSSLAADGAHIRLEELDETVADGTLLPLTLTFAEAGEVTVKAMVADPRARGAAEDVGLFGIGDICVVGDGEPAPSIALSIAPEDRGWRVSIDAEDFTFSKDFVDLYHVPGMGHGHLYVGGMKLGRLYAPEAYIGALPKGHHEIRVTLNTNDHRAYVVDDRPVTAETTIVVN